MADALATCDMCARDIAWARTPAGKAMPIDPGRWPDDDARANLGVSRDHHGRILARVLSAADPLRANEHRGMPHFATCPHLLQARKGQKRGRVVDLASRRTTRR